MSRARLAPLVRSSAGRRGWELTPEVLSDVVDEVAVRLDALPSLMRAPVGLTLRAISTEPGGRLAATGVPAFREAQRLLDSLTVAVVLDRAPSIGGPA